MIACIISVVIIVILSFMNSMSNTQENYTEQDENQTPLEITVASTSSSTELSLVLEWIMFLEGSLYCIVNGILLGKWVKMHYNFLVLWKIKNTQLMLNLVALLWYIATYSFR